MEKTAKISDCGKYRYVLTRTWDKEKRVLIFLMLNPSRADSEKDDPTIRRCIGYARAWGYGGIIVYNLFAYRCTKPEELLKAKDPIGENESVLCMMPIEPEDKIICAWGNHTIVSKLMKKFDEYDPMFQLLSEDQFYVLDIGKNGCPKHPLFLKGDLLPKPSMLYDYKPIWRQPIREFESHAHIELNNTNQSK